MKTVQAACYFKWLAEAATPHSWAPLNREGAAGVETMCAHGLSKNLPRSAFQSTVWPHPGATAMAQVNVAEPLAKVAAAGTGTRLISGLREAGRLWNC